MGYIEKPYIKEKDMEYPRLETYYQLPWVRARVCVCVPHSTTWAGVAVISPTTQKRKQGLELKQKSERTGIQALSSSSNPHPTPTTSLLGCGPCVTVVREPHRDKAG
jgi:hypothetical protein